MRALSPQEIKEKKAESIPQWFLNAVNDLLIQKYDGPNRTIIINQDDIIELALANAYKIGEAQTRADLFNKGYLSFEGAYESRGWKVEYDPPGIGDNYKSHYKFKAA